MIDNLTYHYQKNSGKLVRNRLNHLNDAQTNSSAFTDDIDNMLTFRPQADRLNVNNNYNYDEEGRLVKDSSERISKIVWRVDGKVKEIQRNGGSVKWLRFDYDAMGNRIAKHVYNNTGTVLERSTYYILDAQGNQISTYDHEVVGETAQFNLKERNIFGSSRIGSKQDSLNVLTATISQNYTLILGNKYYEFTNHLGNVLTVFNDLKIPLDTDSNSLVDNYLVGITNSSDYSPFGVQLDGRTASNDQYRYGFQNQEVDDEIKGEGNSVNYKYRMHDPRVGRFFAVDPLAKEYPWNSVYAFSENRVLDAIELEGLEAFYIHGMFGSPKQFHDGKDGKKEGGNYAIAENLRKNYTRHGENAVDNTFGWNVGKNLNPDTGERFGGKLSRIFQTPDDRKIAAEMLVKHIETVRNEKIASGEITSEEEITLIGYSAGGLVSLQAAEMLSEKGYKVNLITVNTSAIEDIKSKEHPGNNNGINDMLIIKTKGDKLTGMLKGANWEYESGTVPKEYEQIPVESEVRNGILKHFASKINRDSIENSGASKLKEVPMENRNPKKDEE